MPNGKNKFTKNLESGRLHDHSGFYTLKDGSTHLVNFDGKSNGQKIQILKSLRNNQDVISYSVNGWVLKLSTDKTPQIGQPRSAMIFDSKGRYLTSLLTPAIGLGDVHTIVEARFGKGCIILNLDGDFYAKALSLDGSRQLLGEESYDSNAAILVVKKTEKPVIHTLNQSNSTRVKSKVENGHSNDFWRDVYFGLKYKPVETVQKAWYRITKGGV